MSLFHLLCWKWNDSWSRLPWVYPWKYSMNSVLKGSGTNLLCVNLRCLYFPNTQARQFKQLQVILPLWILEFAGTWCTLILGLRSWICRKDFKFIHIMAPSIERAVKCWKWQREVEHYKLINEGSWFWLIDFQIWFSWKNMVGHASNLINSCDNVKCCC